MTAVRSRLWLSLLLILGVALADEVPAEVLSKSGAQTPPLPSLQPLLGKSPVEQFRELLAMSREERRQFMSTRNPEAAKLLMAKLREYESLRPEQRELRLKTTELRWYLLPLMNLPATNRVAYLDRIPGEDRDLVNARLNEWDALTPEVREELLQNEATLQYFTEIDAGTPSSISPARREKLEAGVAQWRSLPESRRREIVLRFNQFFDLKPEEKARALNNVSAAERRQIEKTLKTFERLPEAQRDQCIKSFSTFASLSLEERQQFLKNAERWKLMSPEQRQAWRDLVGRLSMQPPLPQGALSSDRLQPRRAPLPIPTPLRAKTNS